MKHSSMPRWIKQTNLNLRHINQRTMAIPHLLIHYSIESQNFNFNHSMSSLNNLTTVYLTHPHKIFEKNLPPKACQDPALGKAAPWRRTLVDARMRGRDPLPQAGHLPKNCFEFPCPNKILQEYVNHGPWRIMMQNKTNNRSCFSCNHLCFTSPCFHQEIGIAAQLAALHRCPFRTPCTLAKAAGVGCSSYRHKPQRQRCRNGTLRA